MVRPAGRGPEWHAPLGVILADVGQTRFALGGLTSAAGESHLHVVASGVPLPLPGGWGSGFSRWIRDDGGNWHVGAESDPYERAAGQTAFRVRLTPPLDARPDAVEVVVTGPVTGCALSCSFATPPRCPTLRDMNREAADTHLRLLAEAELRGAAAAGPWTVDRSDASFARVTRVARALSDVHALDAEAAEAILADFAAALGVRKGSGQGRLMMRYSASLSRLSRAPWFAWPTLGSPAPGEPAGPGSPGPAGLSGAARLAPLGLTLWYDHDGMDGELHLLSYCRTASGAQFAVAWRSVPGGGHPLPAGLFGVTDDRGARYAPAFAGCGGPDRAGEIRLHPVPPDDVRWFDFAPPGGPALRVHVQPDIAPDDSGLLVRQTDLGPGEHLLNQMAVRLLVTAHDFPPGLRPGAVPTATFAGIAAGLGDVVTALEAAEALSPVSPAPGRLAALCASLRVTGHGITAPPSHDLPEPWLSLLSHYHRRKPDPAPVWDGFAAVAAALPELDGIGLALLGLHTSEGRTVVHLRASGRDGGAEPPGPDLPLSVWVRDSGGRWHAAEQVSWSHDGCQSTFTMRLVPPLTRSSPWIELVAAGRSAEVRARLPLRWGSGHD